MTRTAITVTAAGVALVAALAFGTVAPTGAQARSTRIAAARAVPPPASGQPPFPDCPAFGVIGSRGSGQGTTSQAQGFGLGYADWLFALSLGQKLPGVEYTYNPYPAVGAENVIFNPGSLFGVDPTTYFGSVAIGRNNLQQMLTAEENACPLTQVFFAGYSQGAEVTADLVQALHPGAFLSELWRRIAGTVLFGDPLYNHADRVADVNPGLRNDGILTSNTLGPHLFPAADAGKVQSYCIPTDYICQGLGQFILHGGTPHSRYGVTNTWPTDAASYFAKVTPRPDQGDFPNPVSLIPHDRLSIQPTQIVGQTFTAGISGSLTEVDLAIEGCTNGQPVSCVDPNTGAVRVQITGVTSTGAPNLSAVLGTSQKPGSAIPHYILCCGGGGAIADPEAVQFPFTPIRIRAGQKYAIVAFPYGPNPSNTTYDVFEANDRYGGGASYFGTQALGMVPFNPNPPATPDFFFQTFVATG